MTLNFPLDLPTFWDRLPIESGGLRLSESYDFSVSGRGEVTTEGDGNRLWAGQIRLAVTIPEEARDINVLLDIIRQEGAPFLAYDPHHLAPVNDPGGAVLGASVPVIASLPAGSRELSLSGLPAGYVLRRGDRLSFSYSAEPVRFALHEIVDETVQADGSGVTPAFEVLPKVAFGAAVGAFVTLVKPFARFIVRPGTFNAGDRSRFVTRGTTFDILQTVR